MNPRTLALLAATVLLGLSLWPLLGALRSPAVGATPAAVLPDYLYRNKTIAFYEKRVVRDREDLRASAKRESIIYLTNIFYKPGKSVKRLYMEHKK